MREKISTQMAQRILDRDGHACRYCGNTKGPFHFDHVYPVSKGGETSMDNLVTACVRCNLKKNAKVGVWPIPLGWSIPDELFTAYIVLLIGLGLLIAPLSSLNFPELAEAWLIRIGAAVIAIGIGILTHWINNHRSMQ